MLKSDHMRICRRCWTNVNLRHLILVNAVIVKSPHYTHIKRTEGHVWLILWWTAAVMRVEFHTASNIAIQQWMSWSSTDRRCHNYIWVINNIIAYWGATYIRCLAVSDKFAPAVNHWWMGRRCFGECIYWGNKWISVQWNQNRWSGRITELSVWGIKGSCWWKVSKAMGYAG